MSLSQFNENSKFSSPQGNTILKAKINILKCLKIMFLFNISLIRGLEQLRHYGHAFIDVLLHVSQ